MFIHLSAFLVFWHYFLDFYGYKMREVTTREGAQIQIKIDYPFRTFAKECLGEVLGKFIDFFPFLVMKKTFWLGLY